MNCAVIDKDNSDSSFACSSPIKQKRKYIRKIHSNNEQINFGHWSVQEKAKYLQFLQNNQVYFLKTQMRRSDKIFKQMTKFILTRNSDQCRSRHQKMELKYGSFQKILEGLELEHSKISPDDVFIKFDMETKPSQSKTSSRKSSSQEEFIYEQEKTEKCLKEFNENMTFQFIYDMQFEPAIKSFESQLDIDTFLL